MEVCRCHKPISRYINTGAKFAVFLSISLLDIIQISHTYPTLCSPRVPTGRINEMWADLHAYADPSMQKAHASVRNTAGTARYLLFYLCRGPNRTVRLLYVYCQSAVISGIFERICSAYTVQFTGDRAVGPRNCPLHGSICFRPCACPQVLRFGAVLLGYCSNGSPNRSAAGMSVL